MNRTHWIFACLVLVFLTGSTILGVVTAVDMDMSLFKKADEKNEEFVPAEQIVLTDEVVVEEKDTLADGNELSIERGLTDGHVDDVAHIENDIEVVPYVSPIKITLPEDLGTPEFNAIFIKQMTPSLVKNNGLVDSDMDGLSDEKEMNIGTDPYHWDTDNDMVADGMELGIARGSTDPFLADSDNDGLDDPWEDNDMDGILNLEEQDLLGTSPNDVDDDADELEDNVEVQLMGPGPINANSVEEWGYTQVNVIADRDNTDHNLNDPSSGFNLFTEGEFEWWGYWFEYSHQKYLLGLGGLPVDSTNVAYWNWNPLCYAMWYNVYVDAGLAAPPHVSAQDVSAMLQSDPATAWLDRGAPYRWNNYDTHPAEADSDLDIVGGNADGDGMDDNWDPRPTIPDDRLDTFTAINYIQDPDTGEKFTPGFWDDDTTGQTFIGDTGSFFSTTRYGFPWRLNEMSLQKGKQYFMSLWVGLEQTNPGSTPIIEEWFNPMNVTVGFHNASIGEDLNYITTDDDFDGDGIRFADDQTPAGWAWSPDDAELPTITLSANDLQASKVAGDLGLRAFDTASLGGPACQYLGHNGQDIVCSNITWSGQAYWSTMTFYQIDFYFYIPDAVYAGLVFIDVSMEGDGNIHYQGSHGTDSGPSDFHLFYF